MGYGSCWLFDEPEAAFSRSPEFLYFYLVISFIIGANIVCFVITAYYLTSHWRSVRGIQRSGNGEANTLISQLKLMAKLFFIMGKHCQLLINLW